MHWSKWPKSKKFPEKVPVGKFPQESRIILAHNAPWFKLVSIYSSWASQSSLEKKFWGFRKLKFCTDLSKFICDATNFTTNKIIKIFIIFFRKLLCNWTHSTCEVDFISNFYQSLDFLSIKVVISLSHPKYLLWGSGRESRWKFFQCCSFIRKGQWPITKCFGTIF